MTVLRVAAFSDGSIGGNPAGVMIAEQLPSPAKMQEIAAEIGYSETVFAALADNGKWPTRYYSPESEVPFCGHATIALGAVLADQFGPDIWTLSLSHTDITIEGSRRGGIYSASLQSPPTSHSKAPSDTLNAILDLMGYDTADIDPQIYPALIQAGANHIVIALNSREMNKAGLTTIMFVWKEHERLYHARNAFAYGGVLEDPATGAAAAAFAGYLRDSGALNDGEINIVQGEDMGARSLINAHFSNTKGSSIRVSGSARYMK